MDTGTLVEVAHAKINLGLKVLCRRPDGYHEVRTLMHTVDLADRVEFGVAVREAFTCSDACLPGIPENLVVRAVEVFRRCSGTAVPPLRIHLEKRIPVGAGLGGGSSDAAATLRGLNRLCGCPCSPPALERMAAALGSDVPFLLCSGTALARGRGELLTPLRWRAPFCYVLAYPGVAVSTAWAYGHVLPSLTDRNAYLSFTNSLESGGCVDHDALLRVLENDFQPVVERAYPIVAELRSWFGRAGARASSMSGTGSTVYGVFDDRSAASQACAELEARGYRSFLCRPVPPVP
ncbi:MAG: 4-(cytidine 5'-diphospho)-2-C-methyl-D-erythritol kinase [Candidatus Latescibacterota bacterium]